MNKRQAKKTRKKVIYPLVDEFNLISMNAEELRVARKEYYDYVQKHFRYFHYRDKYKVARKPCFFRYPVGEAIREYLEGIFKRRRKYKGSTNSFLAGYSVSTETIIQDVNQIKNMYGDDLDELLPHEGKEEEERKGKR